MKIEVSSPGKTILHGEHAVVYGKAAIAVSLSLKTTLLLTSNDGDKVVLELKKMSMKNEWDLNALNMFSKSKSVGDIIPADEDNLKEISDLSKMSVLENGVESEQHLAVTVFLYLWTSISNSYNAGPFTPCTVTIDSELSIGSGMGSSASYSVCLSAAILILCGRITPRLLPEDKHLINKWAYEAEKIFHGKPSGIDNTVCTFGGAVLFEEGAVVEMLELDNIHVLIVDTKVPRNTKILVAGVKKKKDNYPYVIDPVMDAMNGISKECWNMLKEKVSTSQQLEKVQDLINMNHHLLNCIGVGHTDLSKIWTIANKYSCASKLTGAGGGGCAMIMLPFDESSEFSIDSLKKELLSQNFGVWDIYLGGPGVQVTFQN